MKVIETAFQEAVSGKVPKPRKGWWGCKQNETYYIMRYQHTMVAFNNTEHRVFLQETRTDKEGVAAALLLIKAWQDKFKLQITEDNEQ